MKSGIALSLVSLLLLPIALGCAGAKPGSAATAPPRVAIETELGGIVVEVYPDRAPITGGNFLHNVDEEHFEGAVFYRTVTTSNQPNNEFKIEVIQGGLWRLKAEREFPGILHETTETTGLRHLDGTLSMARAEAGTASTEFFICIGEQPELDYGGHRNPDRQGFAAFGRVVEGMEVVRAIHRRPDDNQILVEPVRILSMTRVR
ncbi:MAG: peptidylprolyl isomerase [Candidatus Latescibacterota bacterium]|nr:MAG: peptidylprolyl isomerase [Candidatus Latescibacterota bacterium]